MNENVQVLTHSSIKITGEHTLYFDPFQVKEESHDADIVFVTHEHYDHYSPEDIAKVKNSNTIFICPESMELSIGNCGFVYDHIELVSPGDELEINDVKIRVIPAYNVGKQFHPKENHWVGYLVTMNGTSYYIAGDTDYNDDVKQVKCDVALLPVGGTYTMTVEEAAQLANEIRPKLAVPTHYGTIVGSPEDGEKFASLLFYGIDAQM